MSKQSPSTNNNQFREQFIMPIQEPWISSVGDPDVSKRKTIEGRVGKLSKHIDLVGKVGKIIDVNKQTGDTKFLFVKIKFIRHYDTLIEYLEAEGWKNAAPQAISFMDAIQQYSQITSINTNTGELLKVFADSRVEAEGGVNAIHLELISPIYLETSSRKSNVNANNTNNINVNTNSSNVNTNVNSNNTNIPELPSKNARVSFSNELRK